jgi:predicted site-specific integrase-resolvase
MDKYDRRREPSMNSMKQAISLKQWALEMGISYRTAWRRAKIGNLPKPFKCIRFDSGTIRIIEVEAAPKEPQKGSAVLYARINSRSDESDLSEQIQICTSFCYARGWQIERVVSERAPGFGPKRRKLHALLVAPPHRLIVARPSVISRFDLAVTEILLRNLGCQLVVISQEPELRGSGGALEDLTDAISSTCHLHYGPKRGRALVEDLNRLVVRSPIRRASVVR